MLENTELSFMRDGHRVFASCHARTRKTEAGFEDFVCHANFPRQFQIRQRRSRSINPTCRKIRNQKNSSESDLRVVDNADGCLPEKCRMSNGNVAGFVAQVEQQQAVQLSSSHHRNGQSQSFRKRTKLPAHLSPWRHSNYFWKSVFSFSTLLNCQNTFLLD